MVRSYALTKKVKISISFAGRKVNEFTFEKAPIVFGREPVCQVVLDYPFVSRHHCQILEEGGKLYLEDLKSRNGIYVAGKTIDRYELTENFEFNLEKVSVRVELLPLQASSHDQIGEETVIDRAPKRDLVRVTIPPSRVMMVKAPEPTASAVSRTSSRVSVPLRAHGNDGILKADFRPELTGFHPGVLQAQAHRLEAVVIWHDQVVQVKEFEQKENITIGPSPLAELQIASLHKNWNLALVDFKESACQVLQGMPFRLHRSGQTWSGEQMIQEKTAQPKGKKVSFKMKTTDVVDVELGHGMKLYLRYIPATKKLTTRKLSEPDLALKHAAIGSALAHVVLGILLLVAAPKPKVVPQLRNVPERFARLLVEPPQPILPAPTPPPPAPEPPPKKEVAKKEPPRKQEVVKQIKKIQPHKQPKQLAKQNQFPMKVKTPVAKAPPTPVKTPEAPVVNKIASTAKPSVAPAPPKPQVKVESLGALSALGGGGMSSLEPVASNIKIDKNAGGASSKMQSMSGVANALPSSSGKLMAGGPGGGLIKTGGKGSGSGSEYGTQGLRGVAGNRGVQGGVVGAPKLATSGKTEGLTRQQVMDVVQKQIAEVQHCYEKSLLANPSLQGRMEFEWDIEASGTVSAVRVKKSSVNGGDSLGECVKGLFKGMKFPAAKNGQSTTPSIGFPFGRM